MNLKSEKNAQLQLDDFFSAFRQINSLVPTPSKNDARLTTVKKTIKNVTLV